MGYDESMTMHTLPIDLLNTLFAPPSVYIDQVDILNSNEMEKMWEDFPKTINDIFSDLDYDVEIESDEDVKFSVSVKERSQRDAVAAISGTVEELVNTQKQIRQELQSSLIYRLHEILGPLQAPEMADVRDQLDVAGDWQDAVDGLDCKEDLMKFAVSKTPCVKWWNWLLSSGSYASLDDKEGEECAISLLSRRYLKTQQPSYPEEYAAAWLNWALGDQTRLKRSIHLKDPSWRDHPTVHALWLASQLRDPSARLATELDARGFEFKMECVNWDIAIPHAQMEARSPRYKAARVQTFLSTHFTRLIELDPEYMARPHDPSKMTSNKYITASGMGAFNSNGIFNLLENESDDEKRGAYVAQIQALQISRQTPASESVRRPSPRL